MGLGNVIIGVKITKMYDRLVLSWPYYVEKKSKKFNKIDYSVTRVSLDIGFHLSKKKRRGSVSKVKYSSL